MFETYVHVFGHNNLSSSPVLVCQSKFFNILVLVIVGRVISFCFVFLCLIAVLAAMFCFCVGCCWPCCFVLLFALFDLLRTLNCVVTIFLRL